jgi:hypothetical protein
MMRSKPRSLVVAAAAVAILSATACRNSSVNSNRAELEPRRTTRPSGVCPPFPLRNEKGEIIKPGLNASAPYSPRQTCGAKGCHDYNKITEGYHFTQGKGESMPPEFGARYQWASSPGNYGGNWCSPGPLYRQLAPKHNANARTIDMTSFDFVTATCGNCHPGGGPLEFDREGKRYDERMTDPASGLTAGGDNGLDGDYYKARWSDTGVIEADCLLCHMPEYDYGARNAQLANLNFRWAATEGARLGTVVGRVAAGEKPRIEYRADLFDADGNVRLHIARTPRNETCLNCHWKPGWKKRGASFTAHTDVHLAKGLKCVDCHTAGSGASDARIRGREVHQFGKGDDPSGWIRNDLDNTVRGCESCHSDGTLGAPVAKHTWLPPLHLETIACATCHIPRRYTKAALVQASDVYNPAPRITPPAKHIWTFYDQDMQFWNHYGELDLFTVKDQPVNEYRPTLVRYKGKVVPANRVHSSWVGFEEEGKPGLNQLFMRDFFAMWAEHKKDPSHYPQLGKITDDTGDGMVEVNRPEEIDALLEATRAYLGATGFPLEGKRLLYVSDNRKYISGKEFAELPREPHEATPYASVYKYSHNVLPARAALGSGGCTDCHSARSTFFYGPVLDQPFTPAGPSRWIPNYSILGLSPASVRLGALREEWLKPALYFLLAVLAVLGLALAIKRVLSAGTQLRAHQLSRITAATAVCGLLFPALALASPDVFTYMTFSRFALDANHFWVAAATLFSGLLLAISAPGSLRWIARLEYAAAACAGVSGALMLLKIPLLAAVNRYAYTLFDLTIVVAAGLSITLASSRVFSGLSRHSSAAGGQTASARNLPDSAEAIPQGGVRSQSS